MIFLLAISALLCFIPVFSLVNENVVRKEQFIFNIICLTIGFMIFIIPVGFLIGKAIYYLTH